MISPIRVRSVGVTHPGLVRKANEDSHLGRDEAGLYVVADGMGGHANGMWASNAIVEAVGSAFADGALEQRIGALSDALHAANRTIHQEAQTQGLRMGSTVVALCIADGRFACVWAGDSRAYLLRQGVLYQLSRDHTQVQELVDRGLLSPEEAVGHPMSHVISRALGVGADVELEAVSDTVAPRDVFLLCSDGLTGLVSDSEIAQHLRGASIQAASQDLLDLVLARGASDNVTLLAVVCEEITQLVLAGSAALG